MTLCRGARNLGFSSTCFKVCAGLHRKLWRKGARSRLRYTDTIWPLVFWSIFGYTWQRRVLGTKNVGDMTNIWWFRMSRRSDKVIVWIGWHRPSTAAWYNLSREWVALPDWQAATDAKAQPLQVELIDFASFCQQLRSKKLQRITTTS